MTRREAERLARTIELAPGCSVTGFRHYPDARGGSWAVEVRDNRSGIPFVIPSRLEWLARCRAAGD